MVSDALKPNIQDLQQDVIELLEQISDLMHSARTTLSTDGFSEKYAAFQQEVDNERGKVEKLELRMAVVAPMKAGKSTIINAVIGQELLPSHNAAMTTLPTEVVFDAERLEPVLTLSENVLEVFKITLQRLQSKINERGIDWARKQSAHYPQLAELLERIAVGFSIPNETKGFGKINKTLKDLNHLVRLHSALAPEDADPLQNLSEVLRIQTPFRYTETTEQPKIPGKLVIVDTPGPNEAGNLKLGAVVSEELEKSSMVLIVLDFAKLRDEAAEKVKQEVKKVIEIRSKENLYTSRQRI
jgi:GTPase SAR1 family protein